MIILLIIPQNHPLVSYLTLLYFCLPIFSFKRHLSLYENTAARRVSRRQSALLFHDRTNSLDSPNTKVKLIGNLNFCLSVTLRRKICMFSFLGVIFEDYKIQFLDNKWLFVTYFDVLPMTQSVVILMFSAYANDSWKWIIWIIIIF